MSVYADTSWIVSLYAEDANTALALHQAAALGAPLLLTEWQEFEMASALSARIYRKEMTASGRKRCLEALERDLQQGLFVRVTPPHAAALTEARRLALRWTPETGCRAYDTFHVAQALLLKASRFAGFDHRQRALARKAGLRLLDA